ncbi:hypothetical protein B8V81_5061 [Paenibacillus pasadenensis]|uniref:Uncharacterized protein n=2 Tax=Paenibacillus pasadenensis TaxID=217090 RepID=A0A2N5MZK8_9BACL|nr:hypothetical protein B8V81_5061 [Paenibacillus pasadenensis]
MEIVQDIMVRNLDVHELNSLIGKAGITINLIQYQIFRHVGFFGLLLLTIGSSIAGGQRISYTTPVIIVILFFVTAPSEKVMGMTSPFRIAVDRLGQFRQSQKNNELYRAICQLKNLAITKADRPPGSAFILEQLKKFTDKIRPTLNQMQQLWLMGQKDQACEYFGRSIGTPEAQSFASIIRKLDELNPIEMKQQMVLFQEVMRRQRETERMKNNMRKSNLIYSICMLSLTVILLNFMVVGVIIDMIQGLSSIE